MRDLYLFLRFKFRNLRFKIGLGRIESSYPYLSGDTYRLACDLDLSLQETFVDLSKKPNSIFISSGRLSELNNYLDSESLNFPQSNLVVHNGDEVGDPVLLEHLSDKFNRIYCVNWLGNHPKISPIPIGLENIQYLRNGIPGDFDKIRSRALSASKDRPIKLLVAFSLHTNPEMRKEALLASRGIPGVRILQNSIHPYEYLELVAQSKFVLSPQGNGPDCHRTWEAVYLGAIPIVHESAWPFKSFELPVEQIRSWNEIEQVVCGKSERPLISVETLFEIFMPNFREPK